jgi:simple sugar transport system ATP-binding protein
VSAVIGEPAVPVSTGALAVETVNISKRFGELAALDQVSVRVASGSVHALLGENGAGKSTLVKCIMGYYLPDQGSVMVDGREVGIGSPRQAHALGLGMVYQHFTLVPHMTVLENMVMARADVPSIIDWRAERKRLRTFLDTMPFSVPLDAPVATLAAGEKQKAEILKQLYLKSRFLILDEPTSVLTPNEADEILGMVRDMAHAGRITVLIITHKFREVIAFADEVSVLRRGRLVGGGPVATLSPDDMARMMVGDQEIHGMDGRNPAAAGEICLEVRDLAADDDEGYAAVQGVSLAVRAGEIVGIAGVSGNGQSELVQVLGGQRDATAGAMLVHGEPYHARRAEMLRHKVSMLPEEPLRNACVGRMSVADNMAFRRFDQAPYATGPWLHRGAFRRAAEELIARYRVKTSSPDAPIATLSGGNVQRAVLARELSGEVDVLVAANPVFGLDFAAVADIHAQIMAARNRGAAVLLVSEDLDELLELADRIVVIFNGKFVYETPASQADLTEIGRHMAGH